MMMSPLMAPIQSPRRPPGAQALERLIRNQFIGLGGIDLRSSIAACPLARCHHILAGEIYLPSEAVVRTPACATSVGESVRPSKRYTSPKSFAAPGAPTTRAASAGTSMSGNSQGGEPPLGAQKASLTVLRATALPNLAPGPASEPMMGEDASSSKSLVGRYEPFRWISFWCPRHRRRCSLR